MQYLLGNNVFEVKHMKSVLTINVIHKLTTLFFFPPFRDFKDPRLRRGASRVNCFNKFGVSKLTHAVYTLTHSELLMIFSSAQALHPLQALHHGLRPGLSGITTKPRLLVPKGKERQRKERQRYSVLSNTFTFLLLSFLKSLPDLPILPCS